MTWILFELFVLCMDFVTVTSRMSFSMPSSVLGDELKWYFVTCFHGTVRCSVSMQFNYIMRRCTSAYVTIIVFFIVFSLSDLVDIEFSFTFLPVV